MKKCIIQNCNYPAVAKKMCNNHYWQSRQKVYQQKQTNKVYKSKVKEKRNKVSGQSQKDFLFSMLENCTNNCQCCSEPITIKSISNLAHILEKSREDFFIVSNNPKNIVFLCTDCHHRFDNLGLSWFEKQNNKFKELIYNRIAYLSNYLTEAQQTHIKEYLIKPK